MMKKQLKFTKIATLAKSTLFPNYERYQCHILIAQIDDMNEDCAKISSPNLVYFTGNMLSKKVMVVLGQAGSSF